MIELLFIALLQVTEPQAPVTTPPVETVEPAEAAPGAQEATEQPPERLVCRTDRTTGSRVRRERVCQTASQRQQMQEALQRSQSRGTQGSALEGQASGN